MNMAPFLSHLLHSTTDKSCSKKKILKISYTVIIIYYFIQTFRTETELLNKDIVQNTCMNSYRVPWYRYINRAGQ